jgi:hypothetical protein
MTLCWCAVMRRRCLEETLGGLVALARGVVGEAVVAVGGGDRGGDALLGALVG